VPLLLVPVLALLLHESPHFLTLVGGRTPEIRAALDKIAPGQLPSDVCFRAPVAAPESPVGQLFANGMGTGTILLWCAFFMSLLIVYLIGNWLPLILNDAGVGKSAASLITTGFHLGGSVGAIMFGRLMDRFDENMVLAIAYGLAAVVIFLISQASAIVWLVAIGVIAAGFCVSGGQVGLNALSSGYYPTAARGTGVSWGLGIGRAGSIVGSVIGGSVLAFSWSSADIFLLLSVPALAAALAIYAMGRSRRRLRLTDPG
jgi:MFS transporter, AAHS family, 4-hydroxybenzoate transporter